MKNHSKLYIFFPSFFNCLIESSIFIRYMLIDNDTMDAQKENDI